MKRLLKWTAIVVLVPVLLVALLAVLIYVPPVQNWAVKHVASIASEKTGMDISVDHVHLEFPLRLGVEGIKVMRPNADTQGIDTVALVSKAVVDVQLKPLFDKQVEIDELDLQGVTFNTTDFIDDAHVKGTFGRLKLQSHGIDLSGEHLKVDDAVLSDANVSVMLPDSVPPDTTESQNKWKILVDNLKVERSHVAVHMPGDTLQVTAYLGNTVARGGSFDLGRGDYRISHLDWNDGAFSYNDRSAKPVEGLDYSHLAVSNINIGIDSLSYSAPKLDMNVRHASLAEKSGLRLDSLSGRVALDDKKIYLPDLRLRTPESTLDAHLVMDQNAFSDSLPGKVHLSANGVFGKQDIMRFLGGMPQDFIRKWPNAPLTVKTVVSGNMDNMEFTGLNARLPGSFNLNARGTVANLTDMDRLKANLDIDAKTYNLDFFTALVPPKTLDGVRIPSGIGVKGKFRADGPQYAADFVATESNGTVSGKANIDTRGNMRYKADLQARNFQLRHFLPEYETGAFTGHLALDGEGTDMLSSRTRLNAKAQITHFSYGEYNLDGMNGTASIRNGHLLADLQSQNALLKGNINVDALMNTKNIQASISTDVQHVDLYNLKLTDEPMTVSLNGHVDLETDLKDFYQVKGSTHGLAISGSHDTYIPDDIFIDVLTRRDTTHAVVHTGDFNLDMDASGGYKQLMKVGEKLMAEVNKQLKERKIDQMALREKFPEARITMKTGGDNFFSRMLQRQGYSFKDADVHMTTSVKDGLNGSVAFNKLMADSIQLDTLRLYFISDSTNITFKGQVRNNEKNPQFVFNTLFDGYLTERGAGVTLSYFDKADKLGIRLGAEAEMEENGIRLHMLPNDAVIAYRPANINEDNYVFLADNKRVSANLNILADDDTGLRIYTDDGNEEALQDLTFSLNKLNLEELTSVLPYLPRITGYVDGDYHIVKTPEHLSVSSSMEVKSLTYEGSPMGNVGAEFVYMPEDDGSHYVDGTLSVEGEEVGTVVGLYRGDSGTLEATANLEHLPMSLVNGFIPDQMMAFYGYSAGELDIKGKLSKPQVNGTLKLDSCHLVSVPYGFDLRFSDKPLRIVGSHLIVENFETFAHNENPLVLNGNVDFSDFEHVKMDMQMMARNFEIINTKENSRSVAFGKAFVNLFAMLNGEIAHLKMRGKLDVLGTTDVSYILRDSPLTTDNQLDELVQFTDFSDTTMTVVNRPPLSGFNMDLTMDVAKGAHVMAYLNSDHSNYIDLMGGGTLRMLYNTTDEFTLRGRYTLANGEMKYSLPIIPLKTFTIQDGSYIEFTGDPMNPTLNITAMERTKATVSSASGVGRGVDFDCGVIITRTLDDMGLEFTLDAPEDMQLHNELQSMSTEQRGKLAVTMLTTGMYLADGNTSGFSMNGALSSFLENEINNITGNALRTLDLSIGLDNATDASGAMHTDYSFKFAKRFWNNRVKISIGGKVSTGSEVYGRQSFFDNVSLEYRLDDTANKYVKLFFDNNSYDWLEGYTQQYGGGFIWRRTLQHFKDLFRFGSGQNEVPMPRPEPRDTLTTAGEERPIETEKK
ncbi:MAG: translocation/assembly module TamB domain-containing protein [Prevotella sp.]|nr:translocation/assembly module TamB domain-containing protein [Prevotella sp.]